MRATRSDPAARATRRTLMSRKAIVTSGCVAAVLAVGVASTTVDAQTAAQQQAQAREAQAKALWAKYTAKPESTYDTDALLREPMVRSELQAIASGQLQKLMQNINVRGPIDIMGGVFVISGNAPHQGGEEGGVVCIHPHGTVEAATFSKGRVTVYTKSTKYDAVMLCVKDWITVANTQYRDRMQQPRNVQLARAGR
jgi:hypothetical protein